MAILGTWRVVSLVSSREPEDDEESLISLPNGGTKPGKDSEWDIWQQTLAFWLLKTKGS